MGTMTQLNENSYWRDGFKDQLTVAFKDSLLGSVLNDTQKFEHAGGMIDGLVSEQLESFGQSKARVKTAMVAK